VALPPRGHEGLELVDLVARSFLNLWGGGSATPQVHCFA
jgi:hypothetical protein